MRRFTSVYGRLVPQPLIAILMSLTGVALLSLSAGPIRLDVGPRVGLATAILGAALACATTIACLYPVHVRHNMKLYMATAPLFLMAVSLPPWMAGVAAAGSWLTGELLSRRHTGAYPSDIVTNSARYAVVVTAAGLAAHGTAISDSTARLTVALLVYIILEAVSLPFLISPISGESPARVLRTFVAETGVAEGSQYGIALLGAIAGRQNPVTLLLLVVPLALTYQAFKHAREIGDATRQMLESMADAVDLRDTNTGGHSHRVAELSKRMLKELAKSGSEVDIVVSAARVHDIGKIGLPDAVLLKEGRLTDEEQALMQSHPEGGAQLLRRYRDFSGGLDVIRHHHERWDGDGYPAGLAGLNIPFGARIVAVADSFDAITSNRPYRNGLSVETACQILRQGRGTQWDPVMVDALLAVLATTRPTLEVVSRPLSMPAAA